MAVQVCRAPQELCGGGGWDGEDVNRDLLARMIGLRSDTLRKGVPKVDFILDTAVFAWPNRCRRGVSDLLDPVGGQQRAALDRQRRPCAGGSARRGVVNLGKDQR